MRWQALLLQEKRSAPVLTASLIAAYIHFKSIPILLSREEKKPPINCGKTEHEIFQNL